MLNRVNSIRDLGVVFDSKMLFSEHISYIVRKANNSLGFIFRVCSEFRKWKSFNSLFMAYVNSILNYASVIWNPQYIVYINSLERIQNKFLRYVAYKLRMDLQSTDLIREHFRMLPQEQRRSFADLRYLHSICNGAVDSTVILSMLNISVPSVYNTRSHNLFYVPVHFTNAYANSPLLRSMKSYNSLSRLTNPSLEVDIFSDSVYSFRRKIFKVLHQ